MNRRRWLGVACATFLLSAPVRADDDARCIAASEGSLVLRQHAKLHEALKTLAACADTSCPAEVQAECSRRIDEIRAAMPTLILAAKDAAGNDVSNVRVSMDGAPLATALDGTSLSIDPGEHLFVFEETGQPLVEKRLVLREGDHDRRETILIGPVARPEATAPSTLPVPIVRLEPARPWWTTQRTLAVIGGGLGLVGLGLGTSFGLYAISAHNEEKSNCSSAACNNPRQASVDYNTAHQDATASTVAFVAGGAFLAAGAVLFFTAPSVQVTPSMGSHGGGVVFGSSF